MRLSRFLVALALLVGTMLPATAQAQFTSPQGVKYLGHSAWGITKTKYGVYIGPYSLELQSGLEGSPGKMTIDAFCVDFENYVAASWTANINNVNTGDLTETRFFQRYGDIAITEQRYRAAAWLAGQMNPGNSDSWWKYHGAVWAMMSTGPAPDTFNSVDKFYNPFKNSLGDWGEGQVTDLVADAVNNHGNFSATGWSVITPTGTPNSQEFITHYNVVPEPGVVILLATGLVVMGAVAYMRSLA